MRIIATNNNDVIGIGTMTAVEAVTVSAGAGDVGKVPLLGADGKIDVSAYVSLGAPAWASITGKPSTFAPEAHTHPQSDITNLVADLAGKAATSHTHAASDVTSGVFAMARLAIGTPDGTKFVRDDGTLATPPAGAITNAENVLAADVPIVANTFATACTLTTLAAGTWLFVGCCLVGKTATTTVAYTVRLVNSGITAFYASSQYTAPSLNPHYMSIPISAIVVLASPTTVLLQATSNTATTSIKATPTVNNTGLTNTATYLQAIKLA